MPDETLTAELPDVAVADPAATPETIIPDDAVFDPASLDPAFMSVKGTGQKAVITDTPADPKATPVVDPTKPEATPIRDSDEPRNVAELRRIHKQAKIDRDTFRTERDALAAKLAEIEPKATTYEKEREELRTRLEEREAAIAERDATLRRTNARETPEWKEKAEAIRAAAASVAEMLNLPEIKDAGITHTMETLLNPSAKAALNETLRALNDSGKYAEAQDLMEAHRSVNAWRSDLRKIEAATEEEAKTWHANRETSLSNTFRGVREHMAAQNPVFDTKSAEFQALPPEGKEFITSQFKEAEKVAQGMMDMRPEQLAAQAYHTALALRLQGQAVKTQAGRVQALEAELADKTKRLAEYEKAAGGAGSLGGSRAGGPAEPETAADIAAALDPVNLAGYKGGWQ